MWNVKCFVVPVTTGATGIVTKELRNICKQYKENIQWILYNEQLY
jgi:hypothetical protein